MADDPLEVQIVRLDGCLMVVGGLFSFGVLPLLLWTNRKKSPAFLDANGMTLRNGKQIPWASFTAASRVKNYLNGVFTGYSYHLKYPGGQLTVAKANILNSEAVEGYMVRHLPASLLVAR